MQSRVFTIRLVRLAMAASLLFRVLLFALASWNSYRDYLGARRRANRPSLDVQQEQAVKTSSLSIGLGQCQRTRRRHG